MLRPNEMHSGCLIVRVKLSMDSPCQAKTLLSCFYTAECKFFLLSTSKSVWKVSKSIEHLRTVPESIVFTHIRLSTHPKFAGF